MKPIHPNDRPKVIVLSVLSVGMVGFFAMSLMGAAAKAGNPANAKLVLPAAAPGSQPAGAEAPKVVLASSMHPAPPPAAAPQMAVAMAGSSADKSAELAGPADPFRRVLPDQARLIAAAAPQPIRIVQRTINGRAPGSGPIGIGGTVAPFAPPEPPIRLDGIVVDEDRSAMVTCNDRTETYKVGSRISGMYTLLKVSDTDATFRGPHGVFKITVGAEHSSDAPAAATTSPKLMNNNSGDELAEANGLPLPRADGG